MIRVELAERIMEQLGYRPSIVRRGIEAKELEIVQTDNLFSDYSYCLTESSFERFPFNQNLSECEVYSIMVAFYSFHLQTYILYFTI